MTATKNLSIRYINDTTALVTKSFQKNAAIFGTRSSMNGEDTLNTTLTREWRLVK